MAGSLKGEDPTSESKLIEMARAGDSRAFDDLILPYHARLLRLLTSITKDVEDAKDALQDALIRAFSKLGQYRGEASFSQWLRSIVFNQGLMSLRARRFRSSRILPLLETEEGSPIIEPEECRPGPEHIYLCNESEKLLQRCIEQLSQNARSVFELRYVMDLTTEETSSRLGIPISSVKSRSLRARRQLESRFTILSKRPRGSSDMLRVENPSVGPNLFVE